MITGTHLLPYSPDAEADRAVLRDALGLRAVDAGGVYERVGYVQDTIRYAREIGRAP